jgi:60 kDa SS-A/Ro ribonucleoprotein
MKYTEHVTKKKPVRATPVSVAEKVSPKQVRNNDGGGFTFKIDDWTRLERFLILGSEKGTYYVGEKKLTKDNAACIKRCLALDPKRTIDMIVDVSDKGRAVKNDPAIFALAVASKLADEPATRSLAYQALPKVCRIGTHLLTYLAMVRELGGVGSSGFMRAITRWYLDRPAKDFAFQVVKYQNREGENHSNALRLSHPGMHKELNESQKAIMHWVLKGWDEVGKEEHTNPDLQILWAFEHAKRLKDEKDVKKLVKLIEEYRLPHECIPSEMRKYPAVWEALLPSMGVTALIRNLGKLSEVGLLKPLSQHSKLVCSKLGDVELLRKGRVHPLNLLVALKTYSSGHGLKGNLTWKAETRVVDALDSAFYLAFKAIEPTGKNMLLALDVSGSMTYSTIAGMPITPCEGVAAMSLVTASVEDNYHIMGFANTFRDLKISPKMRLKEAMERCQDASFGSTNCGLAMEWAMNNKIEVDTFCIYTDNEVNTGQHAHRALEQYRQKMGRAAKMVVIGMTATDVSIANPDDAGMMDVVGFDTATPSMISEFSRS